MNFKPAIICLTLICALGADAAAASSYRMSRKGKDIKVRTSDGTSYTYSGDFLILRSEANPNKKMRRGDFGYVLEPWQTQGLLYNVPTWGKAESFTLDPSLHIEDGYDPETDRAYGEGRTANYFMSAPSVKLSPVKLKKKGKSFIWQYDSEDGHSFSAVVEPDPRYGGMPRLHFEFTPSGQGWYSIGYVGAPCHDPGELDELWQPHIWSEKRFPNQPFLSESFRAAIPATLICHDGVTSGVVADPARIPFTDTPPTSADSQFGLMLRNAAGQAQSMVFAPVLGNADSHFNGGEAFSFDLFLYQGRKELMDGFEELARTMCRFADIRKNSTCTLNTTIENTLEYCLSPYAMFIDSLRGCNYSTDVPGAVKNISGLHPLEFAILTDDETIFKRMARPMLEYGLSRERFLFSTNDKVKGQGTSSRLNGPGVPVTDLIETYVYSGDRADYFLEDAKRLYDGAVQRSLNLDFMSYEDRWINSIALYRATGEQEYLDRAVRDADAYLESRVNKRQEDFYDKYSLGMFFWTSFTNQWMELLWLYEQTGLQRFLDAARDGARHYAQYCWMTPVIPEGSIKVNPGGVVPKYRNDESKFVYMHRPETRIEAWKVSEHGLTPESSGTSAGHRAIFMAHHAPFMMRIAALTGDEFLHDIARNAVVGRYEAFPGYHLNAGRTDAFEQKDFAFRSQKELNGHTSIHYNHPQSQLAMLWDYLFSDFYYASERQIDFPAEYSEGYAYCRSFIYGAKPGHFYDEQDVMPYMPAGIVSTSDIQANWLCGYGNGKLYLALANQSSEAVHTTVTFDKSLSFIDPDKEYNARLWMENKDCGTIVVKDAGVSLDIAPGSVSAIAIDGVEIHTSFQCKLASDRQKWQSNHTSTGFDKDRAVILDFGPSLRSVYVWTEADNSSYSSGCLHYAIDGKWSRTPVKRGYPYEFTIELPEEAGSFEYFFECVTPDGRTVRSETGKLSKQ